MAYVFDGFLSKDTQRALESCDSKYTYAIHTKDVGRLVLLADKAELFRLYPITREDCMGNSYTTTTKSYCMIRRDSDDRVIRDGFLLLRSKDEYQEIVDNFPDEIISANPFKTIIGT